MKRITLLCFLILAFGSACAPEESTPLQTITALPSTSPNIGSTPQPPTTPGATMAVTLSPSFTPPMPTQIPSLTSSTVPSSTPSGLGPTNFPAGVDPLTGLQVSNPTLLARRPMAIQVSNLPRNVRPQWGLSLADLVFEYYTEEGTTRFTAIVYGNDASIVGPIRSARLIDVDIVDAYQAVFAYGYAYRVEQQRLEGSDFSNRLVIEAPGTPLYRYNGGDNLVVDTSALSTYFMHKGVDSGQPDLDGMSFSPGAPVGGETAFHVYVHYSSAIYNRWDYNPSTDKYLRYADSADDPSGALGEEFAQSTDRLTKQPLAFDNVVVLYVNHKLYSPGIYDIQLAGQGQAYAFRDGLGYQVVWNCSKSNVVSLSDADGTPYSLKPGATWFEVVGLNTTMNLASQSWRFTHHMP